MKLTAKRQIWVIAVVCLLAFVALGLWEEAEKFEAFYKEGLDAYNDGQRLEKIYQPGAIKEYQLAVELFKKSQNAYPNSLVSDKAEFLMGKCYELLAEFEADTAKKEQLLKDTLAQYERVVEYFPASEKAPEASRRLQSLKKTLGSP